MIEQARIPHEKSAVADYLTVSQGLITVRPGGEHKPEDLIQMADDALYSAKDAGRNAIAVE